VHQQAVEDFSKVRFLSEFSELDTNNFAQKCPSAATAPAGQEDTPPSAEGGEDEGQQFLPPLPLQHLSGANEPIASFTVEEIATKFRFADAVQLCIFAKNNVVITHISPLHYWLPICKNSKQREPALVACAMAQQLGISGETRLEHLGDHSRCKVADGLHT
jgi:hypothetical protein